MTELPAPDGIMQTGMGFMAGKTLLSAVELKLVTGGFDRVAIAYKY